MHGRQFIVRSWRASMSSDFGGFAWRPPDLRGLRSLRRDNLASMSLRLLLPVAPFCLACGGIVVFDDGNSGGSDGEGGTLFAGGSGGVFTSAGGAGNSGAMGNVSSGFGVTTSITAGTQEDCFNECSALYTCGLTSGPMGMMQLCEAFTGSPQEQGEFVTGCVATCIKTPFVSQLIEPNDCVQTVEALSSAWPEFNQFCHGFGQTPN